MTVEAKRGRRQLSDEVADYLRQAIMAGDIAPHASVRVEMIGEALDVSATPVREALQALRVEGFLELVPRKGFRVASLSGPDIRDIFEAHALIAGELAARAAQRAGEDQIARLRELHEEVAEAFRAGEHAVLERKNHEFHGYVYLTAGSERLSGLLKHFTKYVPRAFFAQLEGWPETATADHRAVLDAISAHDAEAARAAMARHIRTAGGELATFFDGR